MKEIVIVSACRTAIGTFGGTLRDINGAVIGSITMKEAIKRAGIEADMIDDIRYGCCIGPTDALNVARVSALMAGIPGQHSCRNHKPGLYIGNGCGHLRCGLNSGRRGRYCPGRRNRTYVRRTLLS